MVETEHGLFKKPQEVGEEGGARRRTGRESGVGGGRFSRGGRVPIACGRGSFLWGGDRRRRRQGSRRGERVQVRLSSYSCPMGNSVGKEVFLLCVPLRCWWWR